MKVKAYFAFLLNTMSSNFFSVWGENLHIHEDRSGMGGSSDVFYRSIHVPVHNCCDEGGHRRQGRLKVKQRRVRIALRFACCVVLVGFVGGLVQKRLAFIHRRQDPHISVSEELNLHKPIAGSSWCPLKTSVRVLPRLQGHAARTSRKWHPSAELRNQWCEV